jgi:hypothetical protein
MELFCNAVLAAVIASLLTEVISIQTYIKQWLNIDEWASIKPFDCSLCLSFWIGLVVGAATAEAVWPSVQVALMAVLIERILYKFKIFWMP